MTDFRKLCREMYDAFTAYARTDKQHDLLDHVQIALAQTEPEVVGPTIDDIWELCEEHSFMLGVDGANEDESANGLLAIARAVLARWGRPAPAPAGERQAAPVPVAPYREVADLVVWLEDHSAECLELDRPEWSKFIAKAAKFLHLYLKATPVPVAVSTEEGDAQ